MKYDKSQAEDIKGPSGLLQLLPYALVFCAASILLTGYRVYFHNQALQLPLVRLLNDPTLYPNDPFARTLPYYASILWRLVAWCVRFVPMEPLLLGLFVAERLLVIYAAGNLARTSAPGSKLAMVGAMAFFALAPQPILGGGTLILSYFEQTSLAVGLFMLAMAAFYRGKPVEWAIWTALGFNCNSMYGAYALTYFGAAFALDADYRREWKRWIGAIVLFLVLSLPEILLTASVIDHGTVNAGLWMQAARVRVPHHIFPTTWKWERFAWFAALLLTAADMAWLARREFARLYMHALAWIGVSVGWVLIAFAAEALRSPSVMVLQPARGTDLWYAFGVIAFMSVCCSAVEGWLNHRVRLGSAYTIGLIMLSVLTSSTYTLHGRIHETGNISRAMIKTPCPSIKRVCAWARESTPKDAIFLIEPDWGEFRALSLRPVFVTWKDGSALLWYRPYASEWIRRMRAIGFDPIDESIPGSRVRGILSTRYDRLTDRYVRQLSARYHISYWMVWPKHRSKFPVAYENRYFKVLDLNKASIR